MEEGFELAPSDDQRILSARSPTCSPPLPSSLIKSRKNNDSQQSLFYSSSTCREDMVRSPRFINLPILESDKPKIKIEGLQPLKKRVAEKMSKGANRQTTNHIPVPEPKDQLRFRSKDGVRIKELEQALHSQTLIAQQLRGRLSLMTQLIEKGLRQTQLAEYLRSRNSNKNMSHVDIFLQLQHLRTKNSQLVSRINQLDSQNNHFQSTITSLESQLINKEYQLREQAILLEENESLSSYMGEFEQKYNLLNKQNKENIAQIKLLQQNVGEEQNNRGSFKESLSVMEDQVLRLKHQKRILEEEFESKLESSREEYVAILLQKDEEIGELKYQVELGEKRAAGRVGEKEENGRLRWELENCMKEREYYHGEYLKKIQESAEMHEIKLKHRAEVEHLRQKIGRERQNRSDNTPMFSIK